VPQSRCVLAARNISKSRGEVLVLERISLVVASGERIGVIGPNGVGKSTLLRVLAGIELPDAGVVAREPADLRLVRLAQEHAPGERSPGQAARIRLEALREADADVLLLDEPSTDLDAGGIALLERLLDAHRGGAVVVSHDRALLERMTRILEFEPETRRVRLYAGGFSEFDAERRRARERARRRYSRHAAERERIRERGRRMRQWEERGYGQGRKKKKGKDLAGSVARELDRLGEVEKPWSPWRLQMELIPRRRGGDVALRLEQAVIERGRFRLGPLDLELRTGERVALLGANGAGKSTLLGALAGELPLRAGRRWVGPGIVLGTLAQAEGPFNGCSVALRTFLEESALREQDARSLLAKFGLGAGQLERGGDTLSPGERGRAALALTVARGVNALILDEPANHLDLEAVEQLEAALAGFAGATVLVTHDRRFLEAFAPTRLLELESGSGSLRERRVATP
jgi:ATPase subunit of ABC transporter with duplicated ATPase domains